MRVRSDVFLDKRRGMWCGRFWALKKPGSRPPVRDLIEEHPALTAEDIDEAWKRMDVALRVSIYGKYGGDEPLLFSDAAQRWLKTLEGLLAPATLAEYRRAVRGWLQINGDHSLSYFDNDRNARFVRYRVANGASDATVAKDQRSLQVFANWAFQSGLLERPLRLLKRRVEKRSPEIYSEEELDRLEEHLIESGETQWLRIYWLARYAVMRSGEIWSLPLQNISLKQRTITISAVPALNWTVKTRQQRRIPISKRLLPHLQEDLAQRGESERWWLDTGSGYPAYGGSGRLTQIFRRRCRELGIDGPKPLHGIRAAGITRMLLDSGGQAERVAQIAGHSVAVMLTHYARITEEDSRSVVDLL